MRQAGAQSFREYEIKLHRFEYCYRCKKKAEILLPAMSYAAKRIRGENLGAVRARIERMRSNMTVRSCLQFGAVRARLGRMISGMRTLPQEFHSHAGF